jgi:hypothetical protein
MVTLLNNDCQYFILFTHKTKRENKWGLKEWVSEKRDWKKDRDITLRKIQKTYINNA